jgi:hypothetical protein
MELLLNLLWLTLAIPAFWVWRRIPVGARETSAPRRLHAFLILSCLLVLLFPVISASDDLHALQQEMEESSPSKRTVRQAGNSVASGSPIADHFSFRAVSQLNPFCRDEICGAVFVGAVSVPLELTACPRGPRAPPYSFLG